MVCGGRQGLDNPCAVAFKDRIVTEARRLAPADREHTQ